MAMQLHPAVWIVAWCFVAILCQRLNLRWLGVLAIPALGLTLAFALHDTLRLLKRTRWLLLAIVVLFVAASPGERLPGIPGNMGMTFDGLHLAAEHVLRIVLLLALLALLLRKLKRAGLLAGLHCLLLPMGRYRDRLVVRLTLALEYVEQKQEVQWRDWLGAPAVAGPETLLLPLAPLSATDTMLIVLALIAIVGGLVL